MECLLNPHQSTVGAGTKVANFPGYRMTYICSTDLEIRIHPQRGSPSQANSQDTIGILLACRLVPCSNNNGRPEELWLCHMQIEISTAGWTHETLENSLIPLPNISTCPAFD